MGDEMDGGRVGEDGVAWCWWLLEVDDGVRGVGKGRGRSEATG